ncbi:MAG: response regulator transcription factor [Gammaproteobacteria bacterium]
MSRILIVEDNADLALGLCNNLEIEGYVVETVADGNQGVVRCLASRPDLLILDLMLPGKDGFRVLREIRANGYQGRVLLLTARGEESDKVRGLKLGADDYVTKPFGLLEFLARVEALLRRQGKEAVEDLLEFDGISINTQTREVHQEQVLLDLAPKEYELLLALASQREKALSREELLRQVWGHSSPVPSRTVDTHVAELRRKLQDDVASPRFIATVRKTGYRFIAAPRMRDRPTD